MLNEIIFLILAAVILVGAILMLAADEPVHSAVYLGLVLGGVAGIYLTLGAEFLAAIQILIYVGAVVTLILFAVMLTTHASPTEGFAEDRTPLSTLGIDAAPQGMDVESLEEVPPEAQTIEEAERHAQEDRGEEHTVRKDEQDEASSDPASKPEGDEDSSEAEEPGARESEETDETSSSDQPDADEAAEGDDETPAEDEAPDDGDEEERS